MNATPATAPTFAADITIAVVVLAAQLYGAQAAAILAGAISGPVLGHLPAFLGAAQQDRYEHGLADLAVSLGDDAYARAQQRGATMSTTTSSASRWPTWRPWSARLSGRAFRISFLSKRTVFARRAKRTFFEGYFS